MLLPALLVLLAAAPASAAPAKPASCLKPAAGASAPKSLDDLRECQDRARADLVNAAASKGKPLSEAQLDKIDDGQRAEARKFLAQPSVVSAGTPGTDEPAESAKAASSGDDSHAAAPRNKLGGATAADLGRVDAKSALALKGLQGRMQAAAGDGKNGVTPAMADDVTATLTQMQGGVSPDMQALLNGVSKDGGKLTPETMKLLQGAGKSAKGEGLDLNIDSGVEKQLLESDFDKEKPAGAAAAPGM